MQNSALIDIKAFWHCRGQVFIKEALMSMGDHLCTSKVKISIEVGFKVNRSSSQNLACLVMASFYINYSINYSFNVSGSLSVFLLCSIVASFSTGVVLMSMRRNF